MSDIISELSRISEDELRMQIALIDNVNISNAVKETGYRLVNVLADVANSFTQSIGIKNSIDYEVKKVSDLVREDCLRYKALDREKLEKMLYERLEVMCPEIEGDMKDKEVKEQMSRYIIDEAASAYGINKYMSPAHKIEEISIRYNNAFLNNIMNQIRNLTAVQKKSYAEQVGRKLGVASMETKREVQKSLMPEKFNGEGIIDVLGRQRSTTKLEAAIRLLGEDAFWSTEAQVKTMYQAVRNMTRISKLQAAGYIWKVSHANDIKFYAPSDLMPSYIAADKKKAADDKDREYRVMCNQVEKARKELEKCEKDVSVKTDRMTEAQKKAYILADNRMALDAGWDDDLLAVEMEEVKDDYINNRKTEDESKRYYVQVNDTKREMDRSLDDSDRKKKRLQETEKELKLACEKAEERKIYLESVQKTADEETKKRAKELKIKWTAFFFKYSFDDEVFESAVSIFSREELRYIEETLKEAHDSASMLAVGDNNVIRAYTGGKYTAVITYEDRHIISIQSM